MINVLFVCHGNICRSPMAEFIFKDYVKKENLQDSIYVESAATSREEIGSRVHRETKRQLQIHGIYDFEQKRARQIDRYDYDKFDYIVVMDSLNMRNIKYIIPNDKDSKIYKLLDFTPRGGDIDDPWYTGDFDTTYNEINEGCKYLLAHIRKEYDL